MWEMIAAAVAPQIINGIMGSNASRDAANTQAGSVDRSNAIQQQQYEQTRADALKQYEQTRADALKQYDTSRADNAPFLQAGTAGVNRLSRLLGLNGETGSSDYGSLMRSFGANDLANDTVYNTGLQFGLDEGAKAINNQASANGSMLSGATMKALTRFGNDYGTAKAGDAYNRFNNDNTTKYNRLSGIMGGGQQALGQVGGAGANYGSTIAGAGANYGSTIAGAGANYAGNVSNNAIGLGNARAASGIAQGNAIGGAISGASNAWNQNQLMNRLFPQAGRSGGGFGSYGMNNHFFGNGSTGD